MKRLKVIFLLVLLAVASTALVRAQITDSFTFTTNRIVPDGSLSGMSDVQTVNSAIGNITSLKVRLKLTGEFNGDLYGYLRHSSGFTVLLNRPGKTSGNPVGFADSGFDITFQDGAPNGDIHVYQSVTTPADGFPLTGVWQPDGRNVDPDVVADTDARTTSLKNFGGLPASGQWTLYVVDTQSGGTNMITEWGLDITGSASPAITWANPADVVYGTALSATQLNATVVYNSTNVPGTFSYTPPLGTVLNAGSNQTLSVTFTPEDTNTFLSLNKNVTITVQKAPLTITADNTNKVYGDALPGFTASYSGFVNGDTEASLTSPVALGTAATSASAVGNYDITASGAVSSNYVITEVNGTLAVTPATITVTVDNSTKAFGQALPEFSAAYSGFVLGEDTNSLTSLAALGTEATAVSDVGTYPITGSGAASPNYSFEYVGGTLTITQALSSGAVISSANPALPGASVTFTVTLSAVAPGAGTPDGSVNFRIDGNVAGLGTLSGGVATYTTSSLTLGSHTVTAEYAGSLNFVGTTNSLSQNQVINTPPVANNDTVERYPTQSVKVRLSTLLANDSDADGDTLGITVSPLSANGGSVVVSGDWVIYTPANGFTNVDSFTYNISDGRGGVATGTVTVAIKTDTFPSANLAITPLGNNMYRIDGSGIPGRSYRLQYSGMDLNWEDLTNVTADSIGVFQYIDTSTETMRLYRTVTP